MGMRKISIIIPCAGRGTRLGIPYPKEMFALEADKVLIDYCFEMLRELKDRVCIVVIISKEKMELVNYLSKYTEEYEIIFLYQKPQCAELLGAIESAKHYFSDVNILMLPDIRIVDSDVANHMNSIILKTDAEGMVFGAVREKRLEIIERMGALKTMDDRVISFKDKPRDGVNEFDSFWVMLSWVGERSDEFLEQLGRIYQTSDKFIFSNSLFYQKPVIFFQQAMDMGVWENIYDYQNRKSNHS